MASTAWSTIFPVSHQRRLNGNRVVYLLSDKEYDGAISLGVIGIHFLETPFTCKGYDALVFTSKNAVAAVERLDPSWRELPSYVIGEGTAKTIEAYGGTLAFTSTSSYGNDFALEISSQLYGKRVVFPRAKVVLSDLSNILKTNGVRVEEHIVYETLCRPCDELPSPELGSALIFTSPSTVECFLRCFDWHDSWKAVCIGTRTAEALPKNISVYLSPKQTIPSCIAYAHTL